MKSNQLVLKTTLVIVIVPWLTDSNVYASIEKVCDH